jgi:uncharacterized LabA/DUF88 family protein
MKNPNQRVGVFIDVQNMYYSARALYDSKVNFGEVLKTAVADRRLVRAVAYTIKADMPEEQSFFDALTKIGLEVKGKDLQTFAGGAQKGDWDVGIAVDVIKAAPKLDAVVIISGDGDFVPLVEYVQSLGCRAEVVSFGRSTSAKLIEAVDDFQDLDRQAKYLIRGRTRSRSRNGSTPAPDAQTPETPTESA